MKGNKSSVLLVTFLVIISLVGDAEESITSRWADIGNYDTGWYANRSAGQTEFVISNAMQLAGLAAIVNGTAADGSQSDFSGKTVTLSANISLDGKFWMPIGFFNSSSMKQFHGVFDGGDKVVSNMVVDVRAYVDSGIPPGGLFGNITGSGCSVKNLRLVNPSVKVSFTMASPSYVGGVAGTASGGACFENCQVVSGSIMASRLGDFTGGIVGGISGGYIQDCQVVSTTLYVGRAHLAVSTVGGIVGDASGSAIRNCQFIFGMMDTTLTDSSNLSAYVGGIVGVFRGDESIQNCRVISSVIKAGSGQNISRTVGGVVGLGSNVRNCQVMSTTVETFSGRALDGVRVGGITGSGSNIENCQVMSGRVSSSRYTGGIAGATSGSRCIVNCLCSAAIVGTTASSRVGGVAGTLSSSGSSSIGNYWLWNSPTNPVVDTAGMVIQGEYMVCNQAIGDGLMGDNSSMDLPFLPLGRAREVNAQTAQQCLEALNTYVSECKDKGCFVWDMGEGGVPYLTDSLRPVFSVYDGDISVSTAADLELFSVVQNWNIFNFPRGTPLVFIGGSNYTENVVSVNTISACTNTIVLSNVLIRTSSSPTFNITGNSKVNLVLAPTSSNCLVTTARDSAALEVQNNGGEVATLILSGSGLLMTQGGLRGAGIGSGGTATGGVIEISGPAIVMASGGASHAGIDGRLLVENTAFVRAISDGTQPAIATNATGLSSLTGVMFNYREAKPANTMHALLDGSGQVVTSISSTNNNQRSVAFAGGYVASNGPFLLVTDGEQQVGYRGGIEPLDMWFSGPFSPLVSYTYVGAPSFSVVTFDPQGGRFPNGATQESNCCFVVGTVYSDLINECISQPTRTHYGFAGWYVNWSNTAVRVDLSRDCVMGTASKLYARWTNLFSETAAAVGSAMPVKTNTSGGVTLGSVCVSSFVVGIPDCIDGNPLTELMENTLYQQSHLVELSLPLFIRHIGRNSVSFCANLKRINLVTPFDYSTGQYTNLTIDAYAFAELPVLQSVVIPDKTTVIGKQAFLGCTALTDVYMLGGPPTVEVDAFKQTGWGTNVFVHVLPQYMSDYATWNMPGVKVVEDNNPMLERPASEMLLTGVVIHGLVVENSVQGSVNNALLTEVGSDKKMVTMRFALRETLGFSAAEIREFLGTTYAGRYGVRVGYRETLTGAEVLLLPKACVDYVDGAIDVTVEISAEASGGFFRIVFVEN